MVMYMEIAQNIYSPSMYLTYIQYKQLGNY